MINSDIAKAIAVNFGFARYHGGKTVSLSPRLSCGELVKLMSSQILR